MLQHRAQVVALAAAGLMQWMGGSAAAKEHTSPPKTMRIGIVKSLFRDLPEPLVMALMRPFGSLMQSQTGLDSDLFPGVEPFQLGKELTEGKMQLGVFQGIEFAWVQQKYPQLRPLMIVINRTSYRRAYLVVRAGSQVRGFADLKGHALALPLLSHEHCFQFMNRFCAKQGLEPARFFSKITRPANAEEALDDVVDGVVQAVIVEEVPLECYKRRKPGRFRDLKIAQASEIFPASVVAYRSGSLDQHTLKACCEGMLSAPKNPIGRQLLTLWCLTGFQRIPDNYQKTLRDIIKVYPPPEPKKE